MVSIITPVYNSEQFIAQNISSVLAQTYTDWEHILVDDCSTDESKNIILSFQKNDSRIKFFQFDRNSGAGKARNKAIEMAQGQYIAFLDSDDYWHPRKLEKQITFMANNNYSFTYCHYYVVIENDIKYEIQSPIKVNFRKMLNNDYIGCLTAVYDVKMLGKNYMPSIRKRQDWALWLKILKKTQYAYCYPQALAYYRVGNNSLSTNKFRLIKYNFNIYYKELNYSWIKSILFMINFLIHYFYYKLTSRKLVTSQ